MRLEDPNLCCVQTTLAQGSDFYTEGVGEISVHLRSTRSETE